MSDKTIDEGLQAITRVSQALQDVSDQCEEWVLPMRWREDVAAIRAALGVAFANVAALEAVHAFQRQRGPLRLDEGIVGPKTADGMRKASIMREEARAILVRMFGSQGTAADDRNVDVLARELHGYAEAGRKHARFEDDGKDARWAAAIMRLAVHVDDNVRTLRQELHATLEGIAGVHAEIQDAQDARRAKGGKRR